MLVILKIDLRDSGSHIKTVGVAVIDVLHDLHSDHVRIPENVPSVNVTVPLCVHFQVFGNLPERNKPIKLRIEVSVDLLGISDIEILLAHVVVVQITQPPYPGCCH